jgi:chromosome segregation ATPase
MNWSQVAPRVAQVTGDTPEQVRAKGAAMAAEWAATAPDPRDARIAELESELERRREYTAEYVRRAEAAESRVRELEAALQEGEAMWLKQAATIARLRMTLDSESAVCAAELARRAAEGSVTPATPEHCCGLSGFNPMLGDECPACRYWARRAAEGGK